LKSLENEQIQASRENLMKDLEEYRAIIAYKKAIEENEEKTKTSLEDKYGDRIDF
jgi:hypothetical protein